ncbi:SBBP repeat-containing protein [Ramlibacter sp. WS9]|uniref:DUF7948 domain-containing protein n=1 Tax=Ramlibacter sp. WS9 TaxID=1882741 RepID=UPI0011434FC4|nr:SBBP repeat-containing protein [Ramlibacter sp. WS9]ROZ76074.1 hypothetical protein EEB15_12980 [Ramlibacter sp. WS9]
MFSNFRATVATGCLCLAASGLAFAQPAPQAKLPVVDDVANGIDAFPLAFEQNLGQADPIVKFLARGLGYQVFLTAQEAVMVLPLDEATHTTRLSPDSPSLKESPPERQAAVIRMRFAGANPSPVLKGEQPLGHKTNYLASADPTQNIAGVPSHAKVKYEAVYPGVDVVYYSNAGRLEYDLLVAPAASTDAIKISFPDISRISVSKEGDLVLGMPNGDIRYHKPVAYQQVDGSRRLVDAEYVIAGEGHVGFRLGAYDQHKPLVIDPILSYSSASWGSAKGVAVDSAGNAYLVGSIGASGLPASTGYLTKLAGTQDAYVAKIDPTGTRLIWATYLGARRAVTYGNAIAVDASGNAYVGGTTNSASFPVTAGAYETAFGSGSFITKLNATGNALAYSTFVNGATIASIAVDAAGNAYTTGTANALVTTAGAFQAVRPASPTFSPFVAKLNAAGSAMAYATYLGGSSDDKGTAVAVDASGNAYATGAAYSANFPMSAPFQSIRRGTRDAFVAKLNPTGSALIYSTYLGGTYEDQGHGVAVDTSGQAYVVGLSYSDDFPVTAGVFQPRKGYTSPNFSNGFIAKLNAAGSGLVYSSFIGGKWCVTAGVSTCSGGLFKAGDSATAVAVDAAGYAYIGGFSISGQFPQVDPIQDVPEYYSDYTADVFFTKVRPNGDGLIYSVVLGQRNSDLLVTSMGVDPAGGVIATGYGSSIPPTAGAQLITSDIGEFIIKLVAGQYPTNVRSSSNPASAAQPVVLTADVQSTQLGGTVTFYSSGAVLGNAPVVAGAASLSANLSPGIYKITAVYSGDGKTSPPLFQIVKGQ